MRLSDVASMNQPISERIRAPTPKVFIGEIDYYRLDARLPSPAEAMRQLIRLELKVTASTRVGK